jgi:hypothetical protein
MEWEPVYAGCGQWDLRSRYGLYPHARACRVSLPWRLGVRMLLPAKFIYFLGFNWTLYPSGSLICTPPSLATNGSGLYPRRLISAKSVSLSLTSAATRSNSGLSTSWKLIRHPGPKIAESARADNDDGATRLKGNLVELGTLAETGCARVP